MRSVMILSTALFGIATGATFAQTPSAQSTTGAGPGHEIGVGDSLPRSDKTSNTSSGHMRSTIAPTLPQPSIGADATTGDYLRAARASLVAGHTGASQQSLEMAETRALDHWVPAGQTDTPSSSQLVANIRDARRAVGDGNREHALQLIDLALAT
jgi:hypothetical protein